MSTNDCSDCSDEEVEGFFLRWSGRGSTSSDSRDIRNYIVISSADSSGSESGKRSSPETQETKTTKSIDQNTERYCLEFEQQQIHRPLVFRGQQLSFGPETQSRASFRAMNWYFHILDRYLEVGYSNAALVSVFRGIPDELANVLKESLQALQILRTSQTASAWPTAQQMLPESTCIGDRGADEWELQNECGYVRFDWNPDTQVKMDVALTSFLSKCNCAKCNRVLSVSPSEL